jgi:hypothetical protein
MATRPGWAVVLLAALLASAGTAVVMSALIVDVPAPRWFEPLLDRVDFETREIRLIVDTDRVPGWNEIDAVELIGASGVRQWVQSARASSSYSD